MTSAYVNIQKNGIIFNQITKTNKYKQETIAAISDTLKENNIIIKLRRYRYIGSFIGSGMCGKEILNEELGNIDYQEHGGLDHYHYVLDVIIMFIIHRMNPACYIDY